MHEISVVSGLIDEVLRVAKQNGAKTIKSISLDIGELTLLGRDQLKFAYEVLTKDIPLLSGSKIRIRTIKGEVRCKSCSFHGPISRKRGASHLMPVFACPKCSKAVEVCRGRECVLRNVRIEKD